MSRTRLAAALGVAALTLGATAAVAQTQAAQDVTITVAATPRQVTVAVGDVELSALLNDDDVNDSDTSSVTYSNPADNGSAKIEVSRDAENLFALTLSVVADAAEAGEGTAATAVQFTSTNGTAADFITGIDAGTTVNDREVTFTLTGDAGDTARTIETDVTFTITEN